MHTHSALPAALLELAGHGKHSASPSEALYVDAGHSWQSPGGPVSPGGQRTRQSDSASLPTADLLPVGQDAHADASWAPGVIEYFPAAHAVHPDSATAPKAAEYLPTAQLLHPALPTLTLYLPAAHNKHCSPIFSDPASHTQLTTLWLPAGEVECVGHAVHEDSADAPTVVEYFPASHWMHADSAAAPSVIEYLPCPHVLHVPESGASWYVPGVHKVQKPPPSLVEPAMHVHAERLRLPAGEFEFGGHNWQVSSLRYSPTAQRRVPLLPLVWHFIFRLMLAVSHSSSKGPPNVQREELGG